MSGMPGLIDRGRVRLVKKAGYEGIHDIAHDGEIVGVVYSTSCVIRTWHARSYDWTTHVTGQAQDEAVGRYVSALNRHRVGQRNAAARGMPVDGQQRPSEARKERA